jgi:hypothetical protein
VSPRSTPGRPRLTEYQRQDILRIQRERAIAIADRRLPVGAKKIYSNVEAFQLMISEAKLEARLGRLRKWSDDWWCELRNLDVIRKKLIFCGAVVMP